MSDCLCIIYPWPLLLPPNKWYLSWPTSSLAFILPVLSCSPSGPTAVWMLGCWPWWTHHSAGSLWPQHNLLVSLLWWNIASPLAKTPVLESLIFFLFPLLLTNKLRLSELESQKGWSWKGLSKSSCPKPIERPVLNRFHSHWVPTKCSTAEKNHKNLLLANAILPLKLLPPIRISLWKTVWSSLSWYTITFQKLCCIYESFI